MNVALYDDCMPRLEGFLKGLQESEIRIFYFHAYDDNPQNVWLRDRFKKLIVRGEGGANTTFYVSRGRNANYTYIYEGDGVRELVQVLQHNATTGEHRGVFVAHGGVEASAGNHIDFGLIKQRDTGGVLVKSHMTLYELDEEAGDRGGKYIRDEIPCNFLLDDAVTTGDLEAFGRTVCHVGRRRHCAYGLWNATENRAYDDAQARVVLGLCRVLKGEGETGLSGGGRMRKRGVLIGPRGGRYMMRGGKRVYMRGGMKDLDVTSPEVGRYVKEVLIKGVIDEARMAGRPYVSRVTVMWDESQVGEDRVLAMLYEYENAFVRVFRVGIESLLNAVKEWPGIK